MLVSLHKKLMPIEMKEHFSTQKLNPKKIVEKKQPHRKLMTRKIVEKLMPRKIVDKNQLHKKLMPRKIVDKNQLHKLKFCLLQRNAKLQTLMQLTQV
jgi:hypothetical protein